MKHPMQEMMEKRRQGIKCGIPSYCSANELVLETALRRAKLLGTPVLIEATANQVNQYGGYTGMLPKDFYEMVLKMAEEIGVPEHQIILAGDHLGPLTWQNLPEKEAMEKSVELVYQYARAGFTKIHLDTSMKVADDPEGLLSTETIARRGAKLYQAAMKGYEELKAEKPDAMRPVFVIGSEVPIPGGAQEAEDTLAVTRPEAFQDTVATYKRVFAQSGVADGWNDVIAVVVQPGVEFGDDQVFLYDHDAATELCSALREYPEVCFEGHSTDYQSAECLKKMVEDGIAILKVGPALTYGLREALFAMSLMEEELVPDYKRANFILTLEKVMMEQPGNWQKHYHGDEKQLHLARKYSFSDRCRYYIGMPEVVASMNKLFDNLREYPIPMNMLHQYMPLSYAKVRDGLLPLDPKELAMDGVANFMLDYEYAVTL
ncbi:MAG: class II D-tagatose-bisphosphate aldolase, non-catalytic subunit [Lachnospiraceae bacterium]|nr:class II D-tagatose-bisphosphate aldolase, non-catalytic subunit [Oscillospiraceae bacterium]MDY5541658.1 class II D-tagatose-bisphosphate aldolase, non-catalytic subunit [Lachnospiraceae bacterium]MDY5648264.1 class II D-tagatose-bisphosphate aldolase, non-catalytic subunit [Lachnospiraceae bacterium]